MIQAPAYRPGPHRRGFDRFRRRGVITLLGAAGLLRPSCYERVHAPTLGATSGGHQYSLARLCFPCFRRVRHSRDLIALFVTLTTPVTLMLLPARRSTATAVRRMLAFI